MRWRNIAVAAQHRNPGDHYLRRLVARITAMSRTARLRRQSAEIERRVHELPRAYRDQFLNLLRQACDVEAPVEDGTGDAGDGLDAAFDHARSDNVQVRMRGLARWIALVYRETHSDASADAVALRRQVLRIMRELKVFSSRLPTSGTHA